MQYPKYCADSSREMGIRGSKSERDSKRATAGWLRGIEPAKERSEWRVVMIVENT